MKEEFGQMNEKVIKVGELQLLEQEIKIVEEYVQIVKKKARDIKYEERVHIEKFKKSLNKSVIRRLMKSE